MKWYDDFQLGMGWGFLLWEMVWWWGVVEGGYEIKNLLLYARFDPHTKVQV